MWQKYWIVLCFYYLIENIEVIVTDNVTVAENNFDIKNVTRRMNLQPVKNFCSGYCFPTYPSIVTEMCNKCDCSLCNGCCGGGCSQCCCPIKVPPRPVLPPVPILPPLPEITISLPPLPPLPPLPELPSLPPLPPVCPLPPPVEPSCNTCDPPIVPSSECGNNVPPPPLPPTCPVGFCCQLPCPYKCSLWQCCGSTCRKGERVNIEINNYGNNNVITATVHRALGPICPPHCLPPPCSGGWGCCAQCRPYPKNQFSNIINNIGNDNRIIAIIKKLGYNDANQLINTGGNRNYITSMIVRSKPYINVKNMISGHGNINDININVKEGINIPLLTEIFYNGENTKQKIKNVLDANGLLYAPDKNGRSNMPTIKQKSVHTYPFDSGNVIGGYKSNLLVSDSYLEYQNPKAYTRRSMPDNETDTFSETDFKYDQKTIKRCSNCDCDIVFGKKGIVITEKQLLVDLNKTLKEYHGKKLICKKDCQRCMNCPCYYIKNEDSDKDLFELENRRFNDDFIKMVFEKQDKKKVTNNKALPSTKSKMTNIFNIVHDMRLIKTSNSLNQFITSLDPVTKEISWLRIIATPQTHYLNAVYGITTLYRANIIGKKNRAVEFDKLLKEMYKNFQADRIPYSNTFRV